jgi:hypothetical protein
MAASPLDKLLEFAASNRIRDVTLAARLGIGKQTLSNWKRRGAVPPREHPKVAGVIGISVDELIGRKAPKGTGNRVAEPMTMYGHGLTEEGSRMAVEWQKLDAAVRGSIQGLIESLVAAQVRATRGAKQAARRRAGDDARN